MRKMAVVTLLLLTVQLYGETRNCKGNAKVVTACFVVHGRATFGAGTPALRIWPVGTKRVLGVTAGPIADDADDPIVPKELTFPAGVEEVFGNFEVCPFTPEQKGHMQMVCVQSASRLVMVRKPSNK